MLEHLNLTNILNTQIEYLEQHDDNVVSASKMLGDLTIKRQDTTQIIFSHDNGLNPIKMSQLENAFFAGTHVSLMKNGKYRLATLNTVAELDYDTITINLKAKSKQQLHTYFAESGQSGAVDKYTVKPRAIGSRLQAVAKYLSYLKANIDDEKRIPGAAVLKHVFNATAWTDTESSLVNSQLPVAFDMEQTERAMNSLALKISGDADSAKPAFSTDSHFFKLSSKQKSIAHRLEYYLDNGSKFEIVSSLPEEKTTTCLEFMMSQCLLHKRRILVTSQSGCPRLVEEIVSHLFPKHSLKIAYIYTTDRDRNTVHCETHSINESGGISVASETLRFTHDEAKTGPKLIDVLDTCNIVFANPLDLNFKNPVTESILGSSIGSFDLTICFKAHEMLDCITLFVTSLAPRTVYFMNSLTWPLPRLRHPDAAKHCLDCDWSFSMLHFAADAFAGSRKTILDGGNSKFKNTIRPDLRMDAALDFINNAYPKDQNPESSTEINKN